MMLIFSTFLGFTKIISSPSPMTSMATQASSPDLMSGWLNTRTFYTHTREFRKLALVGPIQTHTHGDAYKKKS